MERQRIDPKRLRLRPRPDPIPEKVWAPSERLYLKSVLLRAVLEEMRLGTGLTKLYAGLLAREMVKHDPKLAKRYRYHLRQSGIELEKEEAR
jgi:hypothetical protein